MWIALGQEFPHVAIMGCVFHWTQAVWRKTQDLGLRRAYMERDAVYRFVRKLLALPFLPHEHIRPTFDILRGQVTAEPLVELTNYIATTWMDSTIWPVSSWSVYNHPIRTNNDVEGWHRRLNCRAAKASLAFYVLVPLLHQEASLLSVQQQLVSEDKLKRYQRTTYRRIQGRIFSLWEQYQQDDITTSKLLRECGQIYGPAAE